VVLAELNRQLVLYELAEREAREEMPGVAEKLAELAERKAREEMPGADREGPPV
jgi:hypothetical protein